MSGVAIEMIEGRIRDYVREYHRYRDTGREELALKRKYSAYEASRCLRLLSRERASEMVEYLRENDL